MALMEYVVSGIIGAVLPLLIQWFLPSTTKTHLQYLANYWSNHLLRGDFIVETKLTRGYQLTEPVPLEELSDTLWEEFSTKPTGTDDHFTFTRDRGGVDYDVDVLLQWESNSDFTSVAGGLGMPETEQEEKTVQHIRISVEGKLPYNNLEKLLFRAYDLLRDIEDTVPEDLSGGAYSLACETGEPPLINEFMAKLGFDEVTASNENGLEIETREDRIRVRNLDESQVDEAITKVHEIVTLFG